MILVAICELCRRDLGPRNSGNKCKRCGKTYCTRCADILEHCYDCGLMVRGDLISRYKRESGLRYCPKCGHTLDIDCVEEEYMYDYPCLIFTVPKLVCGNCGLDLEAWFRKGDREALPSAR